MRIRTLLDNINYIGTSSERCEFNDIILNNISYFNFTPELEYMKLNSNYEIEIYKLPFSTSDKLTLNFDNTMADIDVDEAYDEIKTLKHIYYETYQHIILAHQPIPMAALPAFGNLCRGLH